VNNKLAVVGASGHGKVVAELAEILGYKVFFFDDAYPDKTEVEHWEILGNVKALANQKKQYSGAVVAIGNARIRQKIIEKLMSLGINTPTLKHPSSNISKYTHISHGCVIMQGAVINAFAEVAEGCIVNSNAVVEHDCKLGKYVHICPNSAIAGGALIGERTWVGIGATVRQMINIGADVVVGAGSVVVNDIPAGVTVIGVPAKVRKDKNA
jgi:sugar O-acyltransferase (sialic acid O-acetyltransferase NeuD family)